MSGIDDWTKLISRQDAPYWFDLGVQTGDILGGKGEFPDLEIISSNISEVKRLDYQIMQVKATNQKSASARSYYIGRLVAVLPGNIDDEDYEVEVGVRHYEFADIKSSVDTSRCKSCGRKIIAGYAKIREHEGEHHAFCSFCWED